jgi:hypothetical protein
MSSVSSVSSANDFTDKDYFVNIARFLEGYCDLKKLSEINKSSNALIKRETNLKDIVRTKRNKYNCDMLERNLIKKFRYEHDNDYRKTLDKLKKSTKNYKTLTDKECLYMMFRQHVVLYSKKMNEKCLPYLEDIITYYFNEKNKINAGLNIQKMSLYISKYLYNIILSSKNNYKLKNENVVIWLSHHI